MAENGRKIVCPVDETQASIRAFQWAMENIYRTGDEVHLLHVIPTGRTVVVTTDLGLEGLMEDDEETKKRTYEHAEAFLQKYFVGPLADQGVPNQVDIIKCSTDNDSIGAAISTRAEQIKAACVVLAKHNRGPIKEFFIGSVTSYCTHHCRCPVLVMHTD